MLRSINVFSIPDFDGNDEISLKNEIEEEIVENKNTPIENRNLQGQVLKTFIKGKLAFDRHSN